MPILEWINFGKVSAERDDLLGNYFYDNGVLKSVLESPSSFLVLGRKGAGKTAVFKHLSTKKNDFVGRDNILVSLSFEDYNWNIHSLLINSGKAESMLYKQSWRFVILIECIKAFYTWYEENKKKAPKHLTAAHRLLEKLFDSPIPSIYQIVGRKLLSLSALSLPKIGADIEDGDFGGISADAGSITFDQLQGDPSLQDHLSQNIENLIDYFDRTLAIELHERPKIFICFDRVDEAWDDVSYETSKKVIAGLITASDSICTQYAGAIRPIVFLREDIFDVLSINDSNKLREDCGALLNWERASLQNLILKRVNYHGQLQNKPAIADIDSLFDKEEMRQRAKPSSYIFKRTMMRPRDAISLLSRVVDAMRDSARDPFAEAPAQPSEKLEVEAIYAAEPGYSEWLKKELLDEWKVQKPIIEDLFNAIQNAGSTNFTKEQLHAELVKTELGKSVTAADMSSNLRFLFDNSIIGFKVGESTQWRYKCFYPSQGFLEADEYKVHDGLVRALNLKEPRDREG